MTDIVSTRSSGMAPTADITLNAAARLWFLVAVAGQWMFVYYIVGFYYRSAVQGNVEKWGTVLPDGIITGDVMGNIALAAHVFMAAVITFGGALQLVPQIRARALPFHRWNGRVFVLTAFIMSLSGLYMVWTRGTVGGLFGHVIISINAGLIMICAVMAFRYALARNITTHRRWALRLYVLVSGVWFFRVGISLWIYLNGGPRGFDPITFQGPFLIFLYLAVYLLPLGIIELYLRTQDSAGARGRYAMAGVLGVVTLGMAVGIVMTTLNMWLPRV